MKDFSNFKKDLFLFFAFWLFWGCLSIIWIKFPYYDWFNYHYYNGYAFSENRYAQDFMAANFRSYFIPYIDFIQYHLLNFFNNFPGVFLFIEALDNAIVFFTFYKICDFVFEKNIKFKNLSIIWCILFIIFAPITYLLSEFSMADMKIAALIIVGFYILLKKLFEENNLKYIFFSGLLFGIAAALKLTASLFCVVGFICILFLYKRIKHPIKILTSYSAGILISFAAIAGSWYFLMYKYFENPFFPYFNNIFHSPYTNSVAFINDDFGHIKARNILEFIFFPFCHSFEHHFGSDENFFDPRPALTFIFLIFLLPILKKKSNDEYFFDIIKTNHLYLIVLFVIFSYYLNTAVFGTYRYIITTFIFMSVIVIVSLYVMCKKYSSKLFIKLSAILLAFTVLGTYKGSCYTKVKISLNNQIIQVQDMKIEDDSYVLMIGNRISFVIPFQNPKARYIVAPLPKYLFNDDNKKYLPNDIVFSALNVSSKYLDYELTDIMNSDKKIYYITLKRNKSIKNIYEQGLEYYSGGDRTIENCQDIKILVFGKIYNQVKICEYNKG